MKRFPIRVRSAALFRRIAMMTLLVGVLTVFVSCDNWIISTWTNNTPVPIYVTNNNNATTVLRPQEKRSFPGGFYAKGEPGPASYVIKAYEFLPGKGDISGWDDEAGKRVYGGRGDLLFCVTYTWEEINAMNYAVTITQNVFPGQSPPDCPP